MAAWDGLNRRKFPRVNYPCLVVIIGGDGRKGKDSVILTHTENVGIGGVCVVLKDNIPMFTKIKVELDLLDLDNHVKCEGKIVWNVQRKGHIKKRQNFYDVGIEFEGITEKEELRLRKIVERLVEDQLESA